MKETAAVKVRSLQRQRRGGCAKQVRLSHLASSWALPAAHPPTPPTRPACRGARGTAAQRCRGAARCQTGQPHNRHPGRQTVRHVARGLLLPATQRRRLVLRQPQACGRQLGWQIAGHGSCMGTGRRKENGRGWLESWSRRQAAGAARATAVNPSLGQQRAGLPSHR